MSIDQLKNNLELKKTLPVSIVYLLVSIIIFAIKWLAYYRTGSQAVFSDALEGIVNIFAALIALTLIYFALQPADKDHPYGHGKLEFFSAAFEGTLLFIAGIVIIIDSIKTLHGEHQITQFSFGLLLMVLTGLGNLLLSLYLNKKGKQLNSLALIASSKHVASDVWTTVGVVFGVFFVWITNLTFMDSLIAIAVGIHLLFEAWEIIVKSFSSLMDAGDKNFIKELQKLIVKNRFPGMIQVHHVRIIRSGRFHHIDAHLVVPEFWDIKKTHHLTHHFENKICTDYTHHAEIVFHVDPCLKRYCSFCNYEPCEIRQKPFKKLKEMTLVELLEPEEPLEDISN